MPEHWQYKQPATAGARADATGDSDSTQSSEPGVLDPEPEDTEEDMSGSLGVAALAEEISQLLQGMQEVAPLPTLASTNLPTISRVMPEVAQHAMQCICGSGGEG